METHEDGHRRSRSAGHTKEKENGSQVREERHMGGTKDKGDEETKVVPGPEEDRGGGGGGTVGFRKAQSEGRYLLQTEGLLKEGGKLGVASRGGGREHRGRANEGGTAGGGAGRWRRGERGGAASRRGTGRGEISAGESEGVREGISFEPRGERGRARGRGWGDGGSWRDGGGGRGGGGSWRDGGEGRGDGGSWRADWEIRRDGRGGGGGGGRWRDGRGGRPTRDTWRGRSAGHGELELSYGTLERLSGKEPSEVAITLSTNPSFQSLLNRQEMRQDLVQMTCLVLVKAFQSRADRGTLQHLAGMVKNSGFLRTALPHYVMAMGLESNTARRQQYPLHLDNILALLSEVLSIFPASSVQAISMLAVLLQASIASLKASQVDIQPPTEEKYERLKGMVDHLQDKSRDGTLLSDRDKYALLQTNGENPDGEGLQDFRTLPIYPTYEEFHEDVRPVLRPNLTTQRYGSTLLYLDTQFRLMREDFVRPLRDGVQQLLLRKQNLGNENELRRTRFDDITVYFDTQILIPTCTRAGLAYIIQFDVKPLKFVRWENSKRLIFGSLLCLSCDDFESFLFATVSDRNPKYLEKGQVQVIFTEETRHMLAAIQPDQMFMMVETTAYFEAYRYVLEGLQEQDEEGLPFQRYIVECNPDVHPPAYVARDDTYNLSCIAEPEYQDNMYPFQSLNEEAWPSMEELGLDESQMRALQLALTKELAIIQGPPGTGKTHVGLKIARALLTKTDPRRDRRLNNWRLEIGDWRIEDHSPMLVVCYTNHALDQFLEGIHTFLPTGIVRVGGRSNSEILKSFNLRDITQLPTFKQNLPSHLHYANKEIIQQLHEEERKIQNQGLKMITSLKCVISEDILQPFISQRHWVDLHFLPNQPGFVTLTRKSSSLIKEWLGVGTTVYQQMAENNQLCEDMEVEDDVERKGLVEIVEEAELIQAERLIEDFYRNGADEDMADETILELQMILAMNMEEKSERQAEQSKEEFQMQSRQKKKMAKKIKGELCKGSDMTEAEEAAVLDLWTLGFPDRWRLYRLWISRYRLMVRAKALQSEQDFQNAADRLADIRRRENRYALRKAKVIGMTTTGAAKYRKLLQEVRPKLIIVEEAAEVLEAHTITTLSQNCEHLILIGDHQQLRPSATVYELAKNFNLEVSMFERLVKMGFPYVTLKYQHRMRPDIARLLTPHIYPELQNHSSVLDYDNIKGLDTNLFFVEHKNHEKEIKDGKSHQNQHEAMFVVSLCRYLLLQDYKPEQITILTTYTGQLYCLRECMPSEQFKGVKVHVVDKYQGEENDIVLLSLVRSNANGVVGFLKIPNRVCVALSRAKKGLYCIGNREMLAQVPLWGKIFKTLKENGQLGDGLTLCCQNHPDRRVKATCAKDFDLAPEGGCEKPCEFRLDCGHVCTRACHPYDPEHKKYQCFKKCQETLCDLGHKCPLLCYQSCPKECPVRVEKTIPKCQHKQNVPCHQDPETFLCQEPCQEMLECGHQCSSLCGSSCTTNCMVVVDLQLTCGHIQGGPCFYKTSTSEPHCTAPCNQQLKCGHVCIGTCHNCHQGCYHIPCGKECDALLICSHKCREPCTRVCPPCKMKCENRCVHSKCEKLCGQPCAPCAEPCAWQCPHQTCNKLCHEPCDRSPCIQPCAKTLACGHPCIGLCGDKCPDKCRICDRVEVTEIFFGTEDEADAYFIQLQDCGHIIEFTAMDTYMEMDNIQANEEQQVAIKLKECPKCRTPIRKNLRYGSHINRSLSEIERVKEKINGHQRTIEEQREAIRKQWIEHKEILRNLSVKYKHVEDELNADYLTVNDLGVLENKMGFIEEVEKLLKIQREQMSTDQGISYDIKVKEFLTWLVDMKLKFTEQQLSDLQSELNRLTHLANLNACCNMADKIGQSTKIEHEVQAIRQVVEQVGPFTTQDDIEVENVFKQLGDKLPRTGLGISDSERTMILSAMNMRPGHWYKCPNGHIYVITECGGAMESRKCPNCEDTIGGSNHVLASGNQVATEMDGAQHAAWSEGNNLLNFGHVHF